MADEDDDLLKTLGFEDALAKESTVIRIRIDTRRYGKQVTVLEGFGSEIDLEALARELKKGIGVGGTSKDNSVELQGDQRRPARAFLEKQGYRVEN